MRECVGGGAFAEMILGALFGFEPKFGSDLHLRAADVDRGFEGRLTNVPFRGEMLDIRSGPSGVCVYPHAK